MEQKFIIWDFEEKKEIELTFKKAGEHIWKTLCCFHKETQDSLYYYELQEHYICYGCGRSGVSYEKYLRFTENLKQYDLVEKLGDPVASYPYKDEEGKLLYTKFRFEKRDKKGELIKTFRIWRKGDKGQIIRNIQGVRRVVYNLDKINDSGAKPIFLLEGEKDVDNLMTRFDGILATTSDIGAGYKKWRSEYYEFFQDRTVYIIPDNDRVSKIFYRDIGNKLAGIAKLVKFVELPDLGEHGDVTDWLKKDGTLENLFELIKKAPKFPLPIPIEERTEVNLKEMIEADLKPEDMIIEKGIMGIKNYMLIVSRHKKGKTLFTINLALNLISGTPFLQTYRIIKKCRVLYVFAESNIYNINEIMQKQIEGLATSGIIIPKEVFENFRTYNTRQELLTIGLTPSDNLSGLQRCLDTFKPDVVIIDPIGRLATFNMRKSENITQFVNLMIKMRDCLWVLVHHSRKGESNPLWTKESNKKFKIDVEALFDSIRGSSNWPNFADTIIAITPSDPYNLPKNYLKVFFESRRGNIAMPLEVLWDSKYLHYEPVEITDLHKKVKLNYSEMIEFLKRAFSEGSYTHGDLTNAISQEFRVTPERADPLLKEARADGYLKKEEGHFGKWYLTKQGKLF